MIPYSYNMVDMGGIDLVEVNGSVIPGIYEKIYDAANDCGDVVLYNWKFAGIEITPQYTQILVGDPIVINGVIQVTELDQITIVGVGPVPPEPPEPPTPVVLVPLVVTENGTYDPADYDADGFSSVEVEVVPPVVIRDACIVQTTSTGGSNASVSIQEGTYDGSIFTPSGEAVNVLYRDVQTNPRVFDLVSIQYGGSWVVKAVAPVICEGMMYNTGATIRIWAYSMTVSFYVISQN